MKKVAIIGGGAAGMMCAATLLENMPSTEPLSVALFDKNTKLGVKVLISGGGRCNVTTGITDKKILLTKYIRWSDFLKPSLSSFPPQKVKARFENHGVPLKIEEDLRVFPVSDDGKDIVGIFEKLFSESNSLENYLGHWVISIKKNDKNFILTLDDNTTQTVDILVIATGGNAYAKTGSSGDGYEFARQLGHSITPLGPSLNSFLSAQQRPKNLSGLSLPSAKLETSLFSGEKKSVTWPMLFTHFGISWPAVFALSAYLSKEEISAQSPQKIFLTIDSSRYFHDREKDLISLFQAHPAKQINSILGNFFPDRLVEEICKACEISTTQKVSSITKDQRKAVCHLLTGSREINLTARRPWDEFVTAGWVSLSEISSKKLESLICPDLYFAGEVMDIDGVTGWFNLQSSRATGRQAWLSILEKLSIN